MRRITDIRRHLPGQFSWVVMAALLIPVAMTHLSAPKTLANQPSGLPGATITEAGANRSENTAAGWDYMDLSGCVWTRVSAQGVRNFTEGIAVAGVYVDQFNTCTSTPVVSGNSGEQSVGESEFRVDADLQTATLKTTIHDFFDTVSSAYLDVNIDLTWTAAGPITVFEQGHDLQRSAGVVMAVHELTLCTDAVATGSVSIETSNFAQGPSTPDFFVCRTTDAGASIEIPRQLP